MFQVYILFSERGQQLYIGVTSDVQQRLKEHNTGKVTSTKAYRPYKIVAVEKYTNKKSALQRERQIKKSGKLRKMFKNLPPSSIG